MIVYQKNEFYKIKIFIGQFMIIGYRWYSELSVCEIIARFIKRSAKQCFTGISQAFNLFTMTHSTKMALFSIMYIKYIDIFLVFGNHPMFGNTRSMCKLSVEKDSKMLIW